MIWEFLKVHIPPLEGEGYWKCCSVRDIIGRRGSLFFQVTFHDPRFCREFNFSVVNFRTEVYGPVDIHGSAGVRNRISVFITSTRGNPCKPLVPTRSLHTVTIYEIQKCLKTYLWKLCETVEKGGNGKQLTRYLMDRRQERFCAGDVNVFVFFFCEILHL